ncbi:MAG: plastocyanin [Moorea sp. SIO1G6]|uniref:plastocyanin n=1 Tax=Moorena sp. SIO1G6 TaxID=2607840 RepID=UPI0013C2478F|nr:plastocyanin [Moorena sp. SIO1G6]NET67831.1 plastocyanin [Moorena sp. SIO1G6]
MKNIALKKLLSLLVVTFCILTFTYGCAGSTTATVPPETTPAPAAEVAQEVESPAETTEVAEEEPTTAEPTEVAEAPEPAAAAGGGTYTIKMGTDNGQLKFEPSSLTIKAGETVKWVMNNIGPHNVVFEDAPSLTHKNMLMAKGSSYTSTFDEPGTYSYYCAPHRGAGMGGTIIVEAES